MFNQRRLDDVTLKTFILPLLISLPHSKLSSMDQELDTALCLHAFPDNLTNSHLQNNAYCVETLFSGLYNIPIKKVKSFHLSRTHLYGVDHSLTKLRFWRLMVNMNAKVVPRTHWAEHARLCHKWLIDISKWFADTFNLHTVAWTCHQQESTDTAMKHGSSGCPCCGTSVSLYHRPVAPSRRLCIVIIVHGLDPWACRCGLDLQ